MQKEQARYSSLDLLRSTLRFSLLPRQRQIRGRFGTRLARWTRQMRTNERRDGHRDREHAPPKRLQDSTTSTRHEHQHPTMGLTPGIRERCAR